MPAIDNIIHCGASVCKQILERELLNNDELVICFRGSVDKTDYFDFTLYRLPFGLESFLFSMEGTMLELSHGEMRMESTSESRRVVVVREDGSDFVLDVPWWTKNFGRFQILKMSLVT